jgi:DNA-binding LacI/PurR family transcriptional regulator
MQKLNYAPNLLARSVRVGAEAAVGLAVPDIMTDHEQRRNNRERAWYSAVATGRSQPAA